MASSRVETSLSESMNPSCLQASLKAFRATANIVKNSPDFNTAESNTSQPSRGLDPVISSTHISKLRKLLSHEELIAHSAVDVFRTNAPIFGLRALQNTSAAASHDIKAFRLEFLVLTFLLICAQ